MSESGMHIAQTRQRVLETLHAILRTKRESSSFFQFSIQHESKATELLHATDAVELYASNLRNSREIDSARQCTTFGIHNDNFQILHENKNLVASNCSTGEQKILLLSLLLTAAIAKHAADGRPPIMLLDDIMSHLDSHHRADDVLSRMSSGNRLTKQLHVLRGAQNLLYQALMFSSEDTPLIRTRSWQSMAVHSPLTTGNN